jgi:glycerophosphoryl diester phosphodiesterase
MMSRGVDTVITDNPALARAVLRERAAMSSAERLLIDVAGLLGAKREIQENLEGS